MRKLKLQVQMTVDGFIDPMAKWIVGCVLPGLKTSKTM